MSKKVVVEIVEQPKSVERFRYESEGRTNRSKIPMTPRTYASIRVLNYTGPVTVVVSCVTTEKPYRQHPNVLVGEDCKRGVCTVSFKTDESDPTVYSFNNMAIQCIKKGDIEQVLTERQKCNVDPFKTGFAHKKDKTFRTGVRLCFQVFIRSGDKLKPIYPVYPIVSDIIRGKDSLEISDISDTTSPTTGGKKIIVFCSKVSQGDIKVRFYRQNENTMVEWEAWVQKPILVHRQAAIVFETPAYATHDIIEPVDVLFELVRPSDGRRSEPVRYFRYVPDPMNVFNLIRKKEQKITQSEVLFKYIQQKGDEKQSFAKTEQLNFKPNIPPMVPNIPPMVPNIPQMVPNIPPMVPNIPPMNPNVPSMNPNIPPMSPNIPPINTNIPPMNANQRSDTCTTTRPPAKQSNLISNLYRHDQAPINGQNVPHQPTHFDNRSFSHNHIQHPTAQSVRCQYGGERPQMHLAQPLHPQVNQQQHHQHEHYQHQQEHYQLQQEHYQHQQEQNYSQSNFHGMYANSGYGGTYLSSAANTGYGVTYQSSAAPYCPIPSFYTDHGQIMYANNFAPEGNIENPSNTLHPLLIQ